MYTYEQKSLTVQYLEINGIHMDLRFPSSLISLPYMWVDGGETALGQKSYSLFRSAYSQWSEKFIQPKMGRTNIFYLRVCLFCLCRRLFALLSPERLFAR